MFFIIVYFFGLSFVSFVPECIISYNISFSIFRLPQSCPKVLDLRSHKTLPGSPRMVK